MINREEQIQWKLRRLWRGAKPRVLDLFSGCGGFSLGFHDAGFELLGAVEQDEFAIATHAQNFFPPLQAPYHAVPHDITKLEPLSFVSDLTGGKDPELAVDVIIGGPPCQAYSRVGRAKLRDVAQHPEAHINDPRSNLYVRYLEFVRSLRPLAVIMENVTDILGFNGRNIPEEICESLAELGYDCRYSLLNAVHYGVPQFRERLFIVGLASELGTAPSFPSPNHHDELLKGYLDTRKRAESFVPEGSQFYLKPTESHPGLPPSVTVEEALADLPIILEHLEGVEKSGSERMQTLHPYPRKKKPSRYGLLMRGWKGFESESVQAHATRYLPRDYRIFRAMKPSDQYPEAHALAIRLFEDELEQRRAQGEQIEEGGQAYDELYQSFVPPYDPGKFPNKWRKMEADAPARTLTAHLGRDTYSHIHYDSEQARVITVREAARLQSFPDGFFFECSMNSGFKQVGNAVPPLMSKALAEAVDRSLRQALNHVPLQLELDIQSRKHTASFRPRARLVSILGDQLISDPAIGLIELVKNAYDADARSVGVEILNVREPEQSVVVIQDDGFGMSLDDVVGKWLSPAVNFKEAQKERMERSPLGRLPIGEKGVGRFAVHKLGRDLELVTRAKDEPEVVLRVNWDNFDAAENYLDGVQVDIETREPIVFPGRATGTRLRMSRARDKWTKKQLNKVHRALRRLQSPFDNGTSTFAVQFRCPEHPELERLEPSDLLERAHYVFRLQVGEDGKCHFAYHCKHPGVDERQVEGEENLVSLAADELQSGRPAAGPFLLELLVWQRSREHLRLSGVSPKELDALCGVSLYRDGLRVYPYGEPGNDWLYLDQERIQAPSEKLGNNQVVGLLHIDQEKNRALKDKTNREGLIENDAFLDLRALVRAGIRLFSSFWRQDRPQQPNRNIQLPPVTYQESARALASAIKKNLGSDGPVRIPKKIAQAMAVGNGTNGKARNGHLELSPEDAMTELLGNLQGMEDVLRERKSRIELLQSLAATGLAAERVVNEFGRHVSTAMDALKALRTRLNGGSPDELKTLEFALNSLAQEFRALAPYEGNSRREAARRVSAMEACQIALSINKERLRKAGIEASLEGEDFELKARPSALMQVLDNLIDNARYWTSTVEGEKQIRIELSALTQTITVTDTGPGIREDIRDSIFEPFYTMRNGSKGLGLHLVRELTESLGGTVTLRESEQGASFVLSFQTGQVAPDSHQLVLT